MKTRWDQFLDCFIGEALPYGIVFTVGTSTVVVVFLVAAHLAQKVAR